ncbi:MAG: hypothetical protein JXA69_13410 [Phycisphaerae bacterium]|nr:hypothetical protein [Phycisphaerae bacterium]
MRNCVDRHKTDVTALWKKDPRGIPRYKASMVVGVCILFAPGSQLRAQTGNKINSDSVIAGILAHDSGMRDLEVSFELHFPGADAAAPVFQAGTWAHKGNLCHYRNISGALTWENSYDGEVARMLMLGQAPWPEGIIRREQPSFLVNSTSILYTMGRTPFGESLVDALEGGTARVQPKSVKMNGHECYVVEGNTVTDKGDDRIFFRYWLDPECGFMPRRREEYAYDDKVRTLVVVKNIAYDHEVSEVSPGVWFPLSIWIEGLELEHGEWKRWANNHWKAIKVAVNTGLTDEQLIVKFPPGTYVRDYPHPDSDEFQEYVIAADGSPDPAGLKELTKLAQAALQEGQAHGGGGTGKGRTKLLAGGVVAGLGICGALFVWVRARSRPGKSLQAVRPR